MYAIFQSGASDPERNVAGGIGSSSTFRFDLLIRGIIGEFAPMRFPPRLPTPGLPREELVLQRLPSRIITATDSKQLGIVEVLPGEFLECADDFALGPAEIEVLPMLVSVSQIVFLHEFRERTVCNDQSVVAAAGQQRFRVSLGSGRGRLAGRQWLAARKPIVAACDFR